MRSVNKVILVGNLTRDPEVRSTPNGQSVTTFGIATNRDWVTRDGQRHTSSEYHEIVAWSRLAEICGQYLKKGKLVYIEGYLKTRSWDTPEGVKKFKTEVVIQDMIMLEKRQQNGDQDYIPDESALDQNMGIPSDDTATAASHPQAGGAAPQQEMPRQAKSAATAPRQHKPTATAAWHPQAEGPAPEPKPMVEEKPVPTAETSKPVASGPIDIDQDLGL